MNSTHKFCTELQTKWKLQKMSECSMNYHLRWSVQDFLANSIQPPQQRIDLPSSPRPSPKAECTKIPTFHLAVKNITEQATLMCTWNKNNDWYDPQRLRFKSKQTTNPMPTEEQYSHTHTQKKFYWINIWWFYIRPTPWCPSFPHWLP